MTIRFAASIVLGFVATTSAYAAEPTVSPPTDNSTGIVVNLGARQASAETRYCLVMNQPASRLKKRICDTRKNLTAKGYDIDAALARR